MSATATPDAETLLRAIAAAAPGLWFAARHADAHGTSRADLTEPLWLLRQAGLVEVGDWVKGLGQGMRLSAAGEKEVATPTPLAVRPPDALPTDSRPDNRVTELERGDEARNAILDPPPAVVAPSLLYANLAWFAVGCIVAWRGGVGLEFLKGEGHPGTMTALSRTGAVTAAAVWAGDWWRLVTACFVHIGLFHLLCNMLMLGMLGPAAEALWGRRRFALIYAVAGVCGGVVAVALHPISANGAATLMAGASGALWGMLTGVVVWVIHNRRHLPPDLTRDWMRRLVFAVLLNAAVSFAPGVSAEAHFGGGAAGAVVAWSVATGHRRRRLWAVSGVAFAVLASLLILTAAVRWSDGWRAVKKQEALRQVLAELTRRADADARERPTVREAVGDDWEKLSPTATDALRDWFDRENVFRQVTPKADPKKLAAAATETARQADAAAGRLAATGELTERYRTYFLALKGYAEEVIAELKRPPRPLSPELMAAWRAYSIAKQRLGGWE